MITKHLYLLMLLAGLSVAGCTAKKVRYNRQKQFDEQGRLVYEHVSYKVLGAEEHVLETDTNINTFYYNADNTLGYLVVCDRYCDTGEFSFTGYISKYFYQYNSPRNQIEITSVFYERCSDYPIKFRKIYTTKGRLLEEWKWEMPHGRIDSTCIYNHNHLITGNDVFDTAYFTTVQTIHYKRVFEYNKWGKLTDIKEFNYYNTDNGLVSVDTHPATIDISADRQFCEMFHSYLYTCEKRETALTITLYLKSLSKKLK